MDQIRKVIQEMISISEEELQTFLDKAIIKKIPKNTIVSPAGIVPNEIFFINKGLLRILAEGKDAIEHTIHFALENQFIADYSSFIQQQPASYTLQTIESSELVVIPRASIRWGYEHLKQGDKLGRLIAEYYFIYQDNRIKNQFIRSPKERYDAISDVFPNIEQRVPQHMIAAYLGITPVHLSRLKKADYLKI